MFFKTVFFTMITQVVSFYPWNMPINMNLTLNTFNSSSCMYNRLIHTEFTFLCENDYIVNTSTGDFYECCFDVIKTISPIIHPQFNFCYPSSNNYNITNHYNYQCDKTNDFNPTIWKFIVFLVISIIIIIFIAFFIHFCYLCYKKSNNDDYQKIN